MFGGGTIVLHMICLSGRRFRLLWPSGGVVLERSSYAQLRRDLPAWLAARGFDPERPVKVLVGASLARGEEATVRLA